MKMQEKNYEFKQRHWQVHKPDRRDPARLASADEIMIDDSWSIGGDNSTVINNAVEDLIDYFWVSMGVSLKRVNEKQNKCIWITVNAAMEKGIQFDITENGVLINLASDAIAFKATVYLEDAMNLELAPVLKKESFTRTPLYKWRSVHSGCSIDEYPDEELRAMIHAGYDCTVIFVKDIEKVSVRYTEINEMIVRAKKYGIKTFLYNYIPSFFHPDEPGVQEKFDAIYGKLFEMYPDASGIHMAGESLEFPSKDPHTTGKLYSQSLVDGIPDTRPSPGWYPCYDYPAYLDCIEKAIHKAKPNAEMVFSTYNWSYQTPELRRDFLSKMNKNIRLIVAYEMRADRRLEGLKTPVMDYTMGQDEPGDYFKSECAAAHELGLRIEGNVNVAGQAWNFGVVPYVPAPYKLINRLKNLRKARFDWGVDAHYTTHHYGWWDCVASDLGKWSMWEEIEPDYETLLDKIAVRDYGKEGAAIVRKAWRIWNDAMDHYVASNEDQYGPWRVGASYPFIFQPNITMTMLNKEITFPTKKGAHFGSGIIKTLYQPYENDRQAPGFLRFPAELRELARMKEYWEQGLAEVEKLGDSREDQLLKALGEFILCSINTVINIKRWWIANMKMQASDDTVTALKYLDEISAIADEEELNVKACMGPVNVDSRIGWEPSMEYVTDQWHLDWKLRQLEAARREIATFRKILLEAQEAGK